MSNEDTSFDPARELESAAKVAALQDEYRHFLLENGENLYPAEPAPDIDEYIDMYVETPPSHLATATDEVRLEAALDAWKSAMWIRASRERDADQARSHADFLAGLKMMFDVSVSYAPQTDEGVASLAKTMERSRLAMIQMLWMENRWRAPWIELIDRVFPGREPTASDIADFEAEGVKQAADLEQYRKDRELLLEQVETLLVTYGLVPDPNDIVICHKIISTVAIMRSREEMSKSFDDRHLISLRMMTKELIESEVLQPRHPAWQVLLDKYFPIPPED